MYQALYRKWRPSTFDDVVGQPHITGTLKKQVQTDRLSHAYLFIGTRGTGKTTCARILAKAVNCEHPVNGNPCNCCPSCLGIDAGTVMDVVELDAASNNSVGDVRSLQDEAVFSPASVKKRVYIIDEVHMLSTSAFNALLKILEEPPSHLMFILCTTELRKVLPTILSRCQRHSFKRIEPDDIAARLSYVAQQEHFNLEPDAARLLARMADGGMRDALSLLDQCSAWEHIDTEAVHSALGLAGSVRVGELLEALCSRSPEKALTLFSELWKDGKDPAGILNELGDLLRDILLLQVAPKGADALISGVYENKLLADFAGRISGSWLMDAMAAIRSADLNGPNPRRAAEMCLVQLAVPETGESLSALRDRISRLESTLKSGSFALAEAPAPAAYAPVPTQEKKPEKKAEKPTAAVDSHFYTDEDAPPEQPQFFQPEPEPRAASEPAPKPVSTPAAGPSAADGGLWERFVSYLLGRIDMGHHSILSTQAAGQISGSTMTVHLSTPLSKLMLDNPATAELLRKELQNMTGRSYQVRFTEEPVPAAGEEAPASDVEELAKFSDIVKFQ